MSLTNHSTSALPRCWFCARWLMTAVLTSIVAMAPSRHACAQDLPTDVRVGLNGQSRLGVWFPIFVSRDALEVAQRENLRYEIDTVDGDGLPTVIQGVVSNVNEETVECLMQTGRSRGSFEVRLFDGLDSQAPVFQQSFELQSGRGQRTLHASTADLTAVIEPDQKIAKTLRLQTTGQRAAEASNVVSLPAGTPLPSNWLGWQAINTLVISASEPQQIRSITQAQWDAIDNWVQQGGRLVIAAGANSLDLLVDDQPLGKFCPGSVAGATELEASSRIEFFADANAQLIARGGAPLSVVGLEAVQGRVELTQSSHPLVVTNARGFGETVFVAMDLTDQRLVDWSGYSVLVQRAVTSGSQREATQAASVDASRGNRVSHFGYRDLTGQLRVALDRFTSVPLISFASIATLIGLYILCIGPGDYFLLRKLTGKMELTWITFPVITALFAGLALYIATSTRPAVAKFNQLEIIDIDQQTQQVRGSLWTHVYTPAGGTCSIELPQQNKLGMTLHERVLSWQGLPGDGLGGMKTRSTQSLLSRPYLQTIKNSSNANDAGYTYTQIAIRDQPLRVSSTRALFGRWASDRPLKIDSRLRLNRRTKHIEGTFSNPLDRPLKNCKLFFENYVYVVPGIFGPGEEIDVLADDLDEQTTSSFLNRRTKDDENQNRARKLPWNPTSTRIDRLAEVMMFYQAAGGSDYVGLTHDYQPFADLSDHLFLSRAVLVGELDAVATPLELDGQSTADAYDANTTLVRIVFPVEPK